MRVVSLLPSATEIAHALGAGALLVGRSAECDFPSEVRKLPIVMRVRTDDARASSAEIDVRVRTALARGESLYELDYDLLRALKPDLILTQDLCRVCSVTDAEVAAACREAGIAPRILTLAPERLESVWASVEVVGQALGLERAGERVAAALRARSAPPRPQSAGTRPRVAVVEWLDPPILAGLWTPDVIEAAGGDPVGVGPGERGARLSWAELAQLDPDLLIASPCSFTVDRTRSELAEPRVAEGLRGLQPSLGTWLADEAYFSRPGPRLADGVELVRSLLARSVTAPPMPVESWARPGARA